MLKDCNTVYYRCRACSSAKKVPRNPARLRRTHARRPFVKMQADLYEVSPVSEDGYQYVLTVHCTYSKYPFFRSQKTKTAKETANALFDVILDAGVVPLVFQSDLGKEFANETLGELLTFLGASQVFSSAVHPQSQGLAERQHRDMTAMLSTLLQSMVKERPKDWPNHVRTLEARIRDRPIGTSGCTPRSIVSGWFNVTPLQSALSLVREIPPDLPFSDWVRDLVADHIRLADSWDVWRAEQDAKEEEAFNEREVRGRNFQVGELVLLQKGSLERRAGGKLLPRADGPYLVVEKPNEHTAVLGDPFTKTPVLEGRGQAVSRLIRFNFPVELLSPTEEERKDTEQLTATIQTLGDEEAARLVEGDIVAYVVGDQAGLLVVDETHKEQALVSGRKLAPTGPGSWSQRTWQIEQRGGSAVRGQEAYRDLLCLVELEEGKLTPASVESLRSSGVVL